MLTGLVSGSVFGADRPAPSNRNAIESKQLRLDANVPNEDAAEVELTKKLREGKRLAELELDLPEKEGQSFLVGSLKALRGIVKQMQQIGKDLKDGALTGEQRDEKIKEADALAQDYQRIVGSGRYQKMLGTAQDVVSLAKSKIDSGQSLDPLLKHLNEEHQGVLGVEFIQLVERGDIKSLDEVIGAFQGLADNGLPSFSGSESIDDVMKKLDGTLATIDGTLEKLGKLPKAEEIFQAKQTQKELEIKAAAEDLENLILIDSLTALDAQANVDGLRALKVLGE